MRNTWKYFFYHAKCEDCDWELDSKNALGLAAQHHDKYDHNIFIDVSGGIKYVNDKEDKRLREEKKRLKENKSD